MNVSIKKIVVPEDRGRKKFNNIDAMMDSLDTHGLLHPLVVKPLDDDKFQLIAGERRYRAATLLGWTEIPITLKEELDDLQVKEIELEENIARENLTWGEKIELYEQIDSLKRKLYGEKMQGDSKGTGWTVEKTAESVGVDKSHLAKQIAFAKMLRENPSLKKAVEHLPLTTAMKKAKLIQEAERVKRAQESKAPTWNLHKGDCRELIQNVPTNSVNLLLTDIPYGIEEINTSKNDYKAVVKEHDNMKLQDVIALMRELAPEFRRVLAPSAHFYIFHSIDLYAPLIEILREAGLLPEVTPIVWDKLRTTAPFRGFSYSCCYELVLFGHTPPREKMLFKPCKSIIQEKVPVEAEKTHVFQKPQALLRYFIEQSTNSRELVLDPFAGSGSTLLAAKNTGREALGFELNDENYYNAHSMLEKSGGVK